ncbi:uracil-DNA glycosylase family protein [Robiginitalea sp. SC105]|uniref:uracil-DNA glycosylase family protein n=1 Tax=Robiginitalea sp. SC105 TaxID=2762332 RepID=UPI00163955AD|nr:uracil-DNA glycosylase family protein [Robiginitalea sp. SC105]MBC2839110.1 uracil-DNA glycosylase family protein [Robiginitalea sp. SC105]
MFEHYHPYDPFLFDSATKWIVGTLPPPRFTTGDLLPGDVDFCYGSRDGQLWTILDRIFGLDLAFENTHAAIAARRHFLKSRKIGICDIVQRAWREKPDASDTGMRDIELRDLLGLLREYPRVEKLLFTGGNSKNGPEYLFRQLLASAGLKLEVVSDSLPRVHRFYLPLAGGAHRYITTVSLTAPSGSANRAVGSLPEYKKRKEKDPGYTVMDFRVAQYRPYF